MIIVANNIVLDLPIVNLKYKTLGDLYSGNSTEKQGAILIDTHYTANAAGATCTARPEDTEIAPDSSLCSSINRS